MKDARKVLRDARAEFRRAADNYFYTITSTTIDPGWVASRRAELAAAALRLRLLELGRASKGR